MSAETLAGLFPLNLVVLATSQVGRVPVLGDGQETVGFWRLVNSLGDSGWVLGQDGAPVDDCLLS